MKALIPAAGVGQRMRPFTNTKPKPLIFIAGKPIIGHILDSLDGVVDEVIVIVGYMKEKLIEFLNANYGKKFKLHYVTQDEPLGLGHAVYLGLKDHHDGPVLITLGDEFFETDYHYMYKQYKKCLPCDGSLGIKIVDDPSHYGVVTLKKGVIVDLEEKPKRPRSNNAIAGVYFIDNTKMLYSLLGKMIKGTSSINYQLTDALQLMVDGGAVLRSFEVSEWYDCGRPEMLLNVNKLLLCQQGTKKFSKLHDTVIIDPVIINSGCEIKRCVIGPNVSIDSNTRMEGCIIENSIIGHACRIKDMTFKDSIIGDEVELRGKRAHMNVGENTEMVME